MQHRKEIIKGMSRFKVLSIALFAVAAVSAVAVSSASAIWMVGGTNFHGTAALATTAVVHEPATLLVPNLGLTITCSGTSLDGLEPRIEALDKGFAKELKFLSCNTNKENCALEVTNQAVPTLPLLVLAELGAGESVKLLFTTETKSTFANVLFSEANTCALAGTQPVKGSVNLSSPDGQLELLSHLLTALGSFENNSLEIGAGNKAYIDGGKALLRLQSDSKWSFL
jgi:hypothetical protein